MSENKGKKPGSAAGRPSGSGSSGKSSSTGKSSGAKSAPSRSSANKGSAGKPASSKTSSGKSSAAKSAPSKSSAGKSSAAKSASSKSAGNRSGATSSKATGRTATKSNSTRKRPVDDVPRNPRRDSADERELHNSANAKRIADERRRKKYNKNRRLYNILFYAAIAVAVISVVIILSVTVLFNITSLTVERGKNIPYSDEEILAACGIEPGDNLFAVDTERAALNVTTSLPYIEVCNISRRLPSTLELDVHSAVVMGSVTTTDGAFVVLSASGRALEYADRYNGPTPLTRLNGMGVTFAGIGSPVTISEPDRLDTAAELVVGFGLYDLSLDSITFDSAGAVTAGYDERIKIEFGVPTNLSQKIQVAASMITEGKIARNESGTLDLSINERAIFTPDYLQSGE